MIKLRLLRCHKASLKTLIIHHLSHLHNQLLAAIVFVPLFGIIFNKLLYFGGYANATNDELLGANNDKITIAKMP
jgi:hypothetical protein